MPLSDTEAPRKLSSLLGFLAVPGRSMARGASGLQIARCLRRGLIINPEKTKKTCGGVPPPFCPPRGSCGFQWKTQTLHWTRCLGVSKPGCLRTLNKSEPLGRVRGAPFSCFCCPSPPFFSARCVACGNSLPLAAVGLDRLGFHFANTKSRTAHSQEFPQNGPPSPQPRLFFFFFFLGGGPQKSFSLANLPFLLRDDSLSLSHLLHHRIRLHVFLFPVLICVHFRLAHLLSFRLKLAPGLCHVVLVMTHKVPQLLTNNLISPIPKSGWCSHSLLDEDSPLPPSFLVV